MKKIAICFLILVFGFITGCSSNKASFNAGNQINVITRESGSGTRGSFTELFEIEEKAADGTKKDLIMKDAGVENNTNSILTTVQNDNYAIGYISMGSLNDTVKAVNIEGTAASAANVKTGTYKVLRPFNIVTKTETKETAKDFIDYILSAEGQKIVAGKYISTNDNIAPFSGNKPSGSITVGGSSSVAPLMEELIEAYKAINPSTDIQLQITDSTTGVNSTIQGAYDIGMASRELKDSEKEVLSETQIALDGIAVIVNKNNIITDLSKDAVKKIYMGKIKNWDDVK